MGLRERWRSGRPEFLILTGSVLGLAGNAAWIVPTLGSGGDAGTLTAIGLGILCSALAPLPVWRGRPRTAPRFALSAMAATAVVLLTPPGIVGGGIGLLGALGGFLVAQARSAA